LTERDRAEKRRTEKRRTEKRRKEKKREENRADRNRTGQKTAQQNGTEKRNRNGSITERGIILLSAHVSQDSSSFRGQIREYKLNAMRFECNRQTFPGRSGSLVTFLGRGGFN